MNEKLILELMDDRKESRRDTAAMLFCIPMVVICFVRLVWLWNTVAEDEFFRITLLRGKTTTQWFAMWKCLGDPLVLTMLLWIITLGITGDRIAQRILGFKGVSFSRVDYVLIACVLGGVIGWAQQGLLVESIEMILLGILFTVFYRMISPNFNREAVEERQAARLDHN